MRFSFNQALVLNANHFIYNSLLSWEWFKEWLSRIFHVSHYVLHVFSGTFIVLLGTQIFRWPFSSPWLLVPVALVETLNETMDFSRYAADRWPWTWGPTIAEAILTLVPALAIIAAARVRRKSRCRPALKPSE